MFKPHYSKDLGIHQLFEAQVERSPDAIAVVFEDQQFTYQELNCRANQLAHHLQVLGIRPEVFVGLYIERSLEMVVGLLAILKAGGAYMPLDPAYPQAHIAFMLKDSQVAVLVTQRSLLETLPQTAAQVVCLDADWNTVIPNSSDSCSSDNPVSHIMAEHLAYTIYTSGSTGKPKGVQISHHALTNLLHSMRREPGLTAQDILLSVTTICFDIAALEIYLPLVVGARLVLASREATVNAKRLANLIKQSGATVMQATPATWRLLLAAEWQGNSQLKILCGGEALPRELADKLLVRSESLWNMYGPTETTIWSAVHQVQPGNKPVPLGRAIANTQLYLLDPHHLKTGAIKHVPIGVPGELCIGGIGLARGYLNRPDLTAEKFILNPFSDEAGDRLYKTGDLVRYLPDGNIEYLGRLDNQVKICGFRIELGAIEAVLGQHLAVRETVVIATEDYLGDKRLVAYIIPQSDRVPTASELRSFLKEKLPDYMVPSVFITLDVIPLTPNSKVDRRALPAPNWEQRDLEEIFVAPRTPLEEALTDIWSQVLGVKQIGIKDNFFDLGGHSLLAVRLVDEIEKAINIKIPLAAVFQLTNVEQMASFFQYENDLAGASKPEQFLDLPTAAEFSNDFHQEYSGLTLKEYKKLLVIVAGRKGKRPRQNSLTLAIREQGGKPPLFVCANAIEEVFPLAKNLDKEQPFYFLESGHVVIGNVEDKIKALAAHHVKDILLIQPEPPYLLCGYSFGAVLIDEIAQQLLAKGKQISLVVILDRYGDQPIYKLYKKLVTFLSDHRHHLTPLSFSNKLRYIQENLKRLISKRFPKYTEREKSQPSYTPQAYPGKVILFCCIPNKYDSVPSDRQIPIISSKFTLLFFRRAGWDKRVKPDLEIITVPGNHTSMRQEPHVKVLAEKLQICLDRAVIRTQQKNLGDSA